jgi:hypothetical protein
MRPETGKLLYGTNEDRAIARNSFDMTILSHHRLTKSSKISRLHCTVKDLFMRMLSLVWWKGATTFYFGCKGFGSLGDKLHLFHYWTSHNLSSVRVFWDCWRHSKHDSIHARIGHIWQGSQRLVSFLWDCSWLRHYGTSRKDVGSIPDKVIGLISWPNPSSRTMALGSTQPLTEMSTRNLPGR